VGHAVASQEILDVVDGAAAEPALRERGADVEVFVDERTVVEDRVAGDGLDRAEGVATAVPARRGGATTRNVRSSDFMSNEVAPATRPQAPSSGGARRLRELNGTRASRSPAPARPNAV